MYFVSRHRLDVCARAGQALNRSVIQVIRSDTRWDSKMEITTKKRKNNNNEIEMKNVN